MSDVIPIDSRTSVDSRLAASTHNFLAASDLADTTIRVYQQTLDALVTDLGPRVGRDEITRCRDGRSRSRCRASDWPGSSRCAGHRRAARRPGGGARSRRAGDGAQGHRAGAGRGSGILRRKRRTQKLNTRPATAIPSNTQIMARAYSRAVSDWRAPIWGPHIECAGSDDLTNLA